MAEGDKIVKEVLASSHQVKEMYATLEWINNNPELDAQEVTPSELFQISGQSTPSGVVAVVHMPDAEPLPNSFSGLSLLLDGISDPGNMGTIFRLADWFGVQNVICSPHCVDQYNPKVIQASMGSFVRLRPVCADLLELIKTHQGAVPCYAMSLGGGSVYENPFELDCFVVIGNESKGISKKLLQEIDTKIAIPSYGKAESLNAAIATGIACSEYRRVNG